MWKDSTPNAHGKHLVNVLNHPEANLTVINSDLTMFHSMNDSSNIFYVLPKIEHHSRKSVYTKPFCSGNLTDKRIALRAEKKNFRYRATSSTSEC